MDRESNRLLNIREFEERKTVLESRPRLLFVELTRNCNLHCIMCRPQPTPYTADLDMDFSLFERLAAELFPLAEVVDLRGWGESTIVRDFLKYVDCAAGYGCRLRLYTNLMTRDDTLWETLARHQCVIGVSFDGATAKIFEAIRGGSRLEQVLANLDTLVKYNRVFHGHSENIHFSTVVQKYNLAEIPAIIELAAGHGVPLVKLFPIFCAPDSENNLRHYRHQVREMLAQSNEAAEKHGVRLEIAASLHQSLTVSERVLPVCVHPWMYCHITPDGLLGFCDHLVAFPQYFLGDMRETGFMEIWNSEAFQQLRAEHSKRSADRPIDSRFVDCNWCYLGRYIDTEHNVYPPYEELITTASHVLEAFPE